MIHKKNVKKIFQFHAASFFNFYFFFILNFFSTLFFFILGCQREKNAQQIHHRYLIIKTNIKKQNY